MKLDAARTRATPRPAADGYTDYTAAQAKAATRIQAKIRGKSAVVSLKLIAYLGFDIRIVSCGTPLDSDVFCVSHSIHLHYKPYHLRYTF